MNQSIRLACKNCGMWLHLFKTSDDFFCSPECAEVFRKIKEDTLRNAEFN